MKKMLPVLLVVSMLCLLVSCSNQTPAASAPAPAASASAPQQEPVEPDVSQPDASMSAAPSEPDTSEETPDEQTAANQVSQTGFLTGAFLNDAERVEDGVENQLTYQIGCATVVSARFDTRHVAESVLDEYAAGCDVGEPMDATVAGNTGTRYHWNYGENEDAGVMDVVLTEANGACLVFLVNNPADAATGENDIGPVQEAVDSWMNSLMIAE